MLLVAHLDWPTNWEASAVGECPTHWIRMRIWIRIRIPDSWLIVGVRSWPIFSGLELNLCACRWLIDAAQMKVLAALRQIIIYSHRDDRARIEFYDPRWWWWWWLRWDKGQAIVLGQLVIEINWKYLWPLRLTFLRIS